MHIKTRNVNTAFKNIVQGIHEGSYKTRKRSSRYGDVLYINEPVTITYLKPRERVLLNPHRDCNPCFFLYESLWMLVGRNDVLPLSYFNKKMIEFSDNGSTFNSPYGYRWRHWAGNSFSTTNIDQLEIIINHLKNKPDSRRAVLQIWSVHDDLLNIDTTKDNACNTEVLFSIGTDECGPCDNTGKMCLSLPEDPDKVMITCPRCDGNVGKNIPVLDMTVFNRSNDLVWGALGANACLSAETIIKSPEGDIKIKDLTNLLKTGISRYPVYSFNNNTKEFGIFWCTKAWRSGIKNVTQLTFEDGSKINATKDHIFYKKIWNNSTYCKEIRVADLRVGDRLWATKIWLKDKGRKQIKKNLGVDTRYSNMVMVAREYYKMYHGCEIPDGHHIHHRDGNRRNDKISNLECLSSSSHKSHHIGINHPMSTESARKKASDSRKAYFREMSEEEKRNYADVRKGKKFSEARKKLMSAKSKSRWASMLPAERKNAIKKMKDGSKKKGHPKPFLGKKHSDETIAKMAAARKRYWENKRNKESNHKIVSIIELPPEEVYDFTVPGVHNAMTGNGVIAHNCHFSMLHEYMAQAIGVGIGVYNQISNNLHVYTRTWEPEKWLRHYHEADNTLDWYTTYDKGGPNRIPLVENRDRFDRECKKFVDLHWIDLNRDRSDYFDMTWEEPFLKYVADPMCYAFHSHKSRDYTSAFLWASKIQADDWRKAMVEWLERRKKNYLDRKEQEVKR